MKLVTHMLSNIVSLSFFVATLFATIHAQLTGSVGPLNTRASKSNICNVLDYGGSIGSRDIGPAILSAFNVRDKNRRAKLLKSYLCRTVLPKLLVPPSMYLQVCVKYH